MTRIIRDFTMLQTLRISALVVVIVIFWVPRVSGSEKTGTVSIKLEDQIKMLGELGIKMNDGVTVDDLLYSWSREEYEDNPFDLILLTYSSEVEKEPWGRNVSDFTWNFDFECVEGDGAYIYIVKNFALISGKLNDVTDIRDSVDFDSGEAWVSYKVNGKFRKYDVEIDNDWADPNAVVSIMKDLEDESHRFYGIDNGQASIWFYLDESEALVLNKLTGNALVSN
jgi:hypothetical protein